MDTVIRVLIVDDHQAVRDCLKALVSAQGDMTVSAEASNGRDALECVRAVRPSIVLMDVSMPGWSGVTTTRMIVEMCPDTKIIAVSRHDDPAVVRGMLDAGATGYVLKQNAGRELIAAIRAVIAGRQALDSPGHRPPLPAEHSASRESSEPVRESPLTESEERVLLLVATAASNEQIGRSLSINADHAIALKNRAMRKAGLASRIQVVAYAQRRGWID